MPLYITFFTVSLELGKAYDTAWRYVILPYLFSMRIRRNMLSIIHGYLSKRRARVRVGAAMSRQFIQKTSVSKGEVLSCRLFIVTTNSLRLLTLHTMSYSIYVDDVQIGLKSGNLVICERQVQISLNKLPSSADENLFRVNATKYTCILF